MQAKTRTCLWFEKEAREAAEFYVSLLPDSRIESVVTFEHMLGPGHADVTVVEFTLAGTPYEILEAGPHDALNDAMSIVVITDDQAETDRLWEALTANGGKPVQCGWLHDRYGVRWQIVPRRMTEIMQDADRVAVRRAMDAMLTMDKLDIATIEHAWRGA